MIENVKGKHKVFAIAVVMILILVGCGKPSGNGTGTNASSGNQSGTVKKEDTETQLRKMSGSPSTVAVVKDVKEMYWAIPASGIKEINPITPEGIVKVAIKSGTRLAGGSGHGDPAQIAEMLLEQLGPTGGPYFFSTKNKGEKNEVSISGQVGEAKENVTIEVKEVVLSKEKT